MQKNGFILKEILESYGKAKFWLYYPTLFQTIIRLVTACRNPSFAFQQLRISAGLPPTRMAGEGDAAKAVRPSQKGQWSKAALEVKAAAKKKH